MREGQEKDRKGNARLAKKSRGSGLARARRPSRVGLEEERANSLSVVIASSLCLVLAAAAFLFSGHFAIGPMLRSAVAAREAAGVGDVVLAMPDGVFCRHMSFDNVTGEVAESTIERCTTHLGSGRALVSKFAWGKSDKP
jgi:hypothetical protein